MAKIFNVNGACIPELHYMVDLTSRLQQVKAMIDAGEYFTINRARQYGKTTMLQELALYLKPDYTVVSLDFQTMSSSDFQSECSFVNGLAREIEKKIRRMKEIPSKIQQKFAVFSREMNPDTRMADIFECFTNWCELSEKPLVFMIDEVDTASNNQVFLDFLAQLRAAYLDRRMTPAFQSVILAGVYDIRSMKSKLRPDEEHRQNSPWNIAADFDIDMSFSKEDIAGMLRQYEDDYHTGMNIERLSGLLYEYTSGYPFLVSRICKLIDEKIAGNSHISDKSRAWTDDGFYEAEKMVVKEDNTLYQSLLGKLKIYPQLRIILSDLLFRGRSIPYVATADYIRDAAMFGFIKNENHMVIISNRIFEAVLYEYFTAEEYIGNQMYDIGIEEKNQFITGGHLNMRRLPEKFVEAFSELYGKEDEKFVEDVGRKYFILFLKPIINGIGNYSVEPRTRNNQRMDLVIFYRGEQYILELKLWRGNAYNERGEEQLAGYLDYYQLKKGYMLSFNFNKNKEIGIKEIRIGDRLLIEAVV